MFSLLIYPFQYLLFFKITNFNIFFFVLEYRFFLERAKGKFNFFCKSISLSQRIKNFTELQDKEEDIKVCYFKKEQLANLLKDNKIRQIEELAGCDKLTISPLLLKKLTEQKKKLYRKIDSKKENAKDWQELEEKDFRKQLNEDSMATEKLAEGICLFSKDVEKLEELIRTRLESNSPTVF